MIRTILVPLDGSPLAERALPVAEVFARRLAGHIVLVRAVPYLSRPSGDAPYPSLAAARAAAVVEAREYLDDLVARLLGRGLDVTAEVPEEDEADGIVAVARHVGAGLIVMATHGRSGLGRWVYGSVAERVLAIAPVPILLVRAWEGAQFDAAIGAGTTILVPLDGSALAEAALPVAEDLADGLGGALVLLRAVPNPGLDFSPDVLVAPLLAREQAAGEAAARTYLADLAARLARRGRTVQTEVRAGPAAATIEAVGRERAVGLIVLGTHGLTGLRLAVVGSVAAAVVRQGSLPVLLVRPPTPDA